MDKPTNVLVEIQKARESTILLLATGSDRWFWGDISHAMLGLIATHLQLAIQKQESPSKKLKKITLILQTYGGNIPTAKGMVDLIKEFTDNFEVIVSKHATSAGTIICLGADHLCLLPGAYLGPVDPSVSDLFNGQSAPVSSESLKALLSSNFISNEKKFELFEDLAKKIDPLVLGQLIRAGNQVHDIVLDFLSGKNLSSLEIEEAMTLLLGKMAVHDTPLFTKTLEEKCHLPIENVDEKLAMQYPALESYIEKQLGKSEEIDEFAKNPSRFPNCLNFYGNCFFVESLLGGCDYLKKTVTFVRQGSGWQKNQLRELIHQKPFV